MSRGTPSIDYHNRLSRAEALMKYSDQIQKFYFYNSHSILFLEYEALYCMYLVCGKICQISWVLHVGGLDWSWSRPTILNTELCWGQGWFLYHQDSWLLLLAGPNYSAHLLCQKLSQVSGGVMWRDVVWCLLSWHNLRTICRHHQAWWGGNQASTCPCGVLSCIL